MPHNSTPIGDFVNNEDLDEWQRFFDYDINTSTVERLSTISNEIANLRQRLPSDEEANFNTFRSWLRLQSIRFDDSRQLDDDMRAMAVLERIAEYFGRSSDTLRLRIVGYSDDLGDDRANANVSESRAELVVARLVNLGIASERLDAIGRGSERRIADSDGAGSFNRRVEFELIHGDARHIQDGIRNRADDDDR